MRPRSAAAAAVALALLGSPAALAQSQGGFSAKPPSGSFRDLAEGRLTMRVHCPATCTVAARLVVAAQDARRMALPFWKTSQLVGSESDRDTFSAGDHRLGLQLATPAVRRYFLPSLAFPLFSRVGIKVELQADFDQGSSATPSVTGSLRWPQGAPENGGRGRRGIVRSIDGPSRFALGTAEGVFAVRLRASGAGRVVRAGVRTAGGLLSTDRFALYAGAREASAAALRRGGTFTLRVPLRGERLQAATDVAPLAAHVFVDVVDEATGAVRDHGIRRFTLTR